MRTLSLLDKATGGQALTPDEALALFDAPEEAHADLLAASKALRRALHGDRATYVINRNMSFTNICYVGCKFCNFAVGLNAPDSFRLTREEARAKLAERTDTTEVCMQGGIDPKMGLEDYLQVLDWVREARPEMHIHAFSAEEIHHACRKSGLGPGGVIEKMREHGLGSMPGTAAEIFDPAVRQRIAPEKIGTERWFEVHRAAHRLGVRSTATMLFGHVETAANVVDHMDRLRALQRETGGFTEFVPLLFIHDQTEMRDWDGWHLRARQRYIERVYAVARLFFANEIPHLQTSWVKLGIPRALETLDFACDDFGGSLFEERITASAGGTNGEAVEPSEIVGHLKAAGFAPRQRTTVYELLN